MPLIQNGWIDVLTIFSILHLYMFWNPGNLIPEEWTTIMHLVVVIAKVARFIQIGMVVLEYYQPHHQ